MREFITNDPAITQEKEYFFPVIQGLEILKKKGLLKYRFEPADLNMTVLLTNVPYTFSRSGASPYMVRDHNPYNNRGVRMGLRVIPGNLPDRSAFFENLFRLLENDTDKKTELALIESARKEIMAIPEIQDISLSGRLKSMFGLSSKKGTGKSTPAVSDLYFSLFKLYGNPLNYPDSKNHILRLENGIIPSDDILMQRIDEKCADISSRVKARSRTKDAPEAIEERIKWIQDNMIDPPLPFTGRHLLYDSSLAELGEEWIQMIHLEKIKSKFETRDTVPLQPARKAEASPTLG